MFKILHLRCIVVLFIIPLIILVPGLIFLVSSPDISIFPSKNVIPYSYTDSYDNAAIGHSLVKEFAVTETEIIMSYILKEGVQFPYAGLGFQLPSAFFNLKPYDEIEIAVKSSRSETLRLFILLEIDGFSHTDNYLSYLYLYKEIPVWLKKEVYHLKLADFKTPEWWFDINNLSELDTRFLPDFSRVFCFMIERPADFPLEVEDTIELSRFLISKNQFSTIWPWIAAVVLYYCILVVSLLWSRYKNQLSWQAKQVYLSYSLVDVQEAGNSEELRIMEYLYNNYHLVDMSVKKVSQACSVPAYKIPSIIKKKSRLSFPAFINSLRVNHAKKLLEKSDMSIIDIAMKSGFNNVSHFNKVFRFFENTSPRNYRKQALSINEE